MPPKRTTTRAAATRARSLENGTGLIPGLSATPKKTKATLPDIPAKSSFAYGSSTTPMLPRELEVLNKMGLDQVAQNIDRGIEEAKDREPRGVSRGRSRTKKPVPASISPVRRSRRVREPTPDQTQLLDGLREATESPGFNRPLNTVESTNDTGSTSTPTPPIPQALSTASSPPADLKYPALPAENLYPSPLLRFGSPARNENPLSSPPFRNSVDVESIISWTVERDIHEDDLRRTHGTRYREEPQGKNITAPPRRFSGLAFANETIHEEEEPPTQISLSKSRSPEVVPHPQPVPETQKEPEPEPEPVPAPIPELKYQPSLFSAHTKTIIPDRITREPSYDEATPPPRVKKDRRRTYDDYNSSLNQILRNIAIIVLSLISVFTIYAFADKVPSALFGSKSPFHRQPLNLNGSTMEVVSGVSRELVLLGQQVSSLSKDVNAVKTDLRNMPVATMPAQPVVDAKKNFLAPGMGAIVDPWVTSPTAGSNAGLIKKLYMLYKGQKREYRAQALTALAPWDDVGDCWCSAPKKGMWQLGVHLARDIVPEQVVVEHIPKGATLTPEVAPQDMELWARFKIIDPAPASNITTRPSYLSHKKTPIVAGHNSLHDVLIEVLGIAYRGEPEDTYWDDKALGSSYYRIGKWRYDIDQPNHIQTFELAAVFDEPAIRVDKVVFRVKSNHGANDMCLYRLKLHGHL